MLDELIGDAACARVKRLRTSTVDRLTSRHHYVMLGPVVEFHADPVRVACRDAFGLPVVKPPITGLSECRPSGCGIGPDLLIDRACSGAAFLRCQPPGGVNGSTETRGLFHLELHWVPWTRSLKTLRPAPGTSAGSLIGCRIRRNDTPPGRSRSSDVRCLPVFGRGLVGELAHAVARATGERSRARAVESGQVVGSRARGDRHYAQRGSPVRHTRDVDRRFRPVDLDAVDLAGAAIARRCRRPVRTPRSEQCLPRDTVGCGWAAIPELWL